MAVIKSSWPVIGIVLVVLFIFLMFRIISNSLVIMDWIPITILFMFLVATFEKKIDRRNYFLLVIFVLAIQCLLLAYTFFIAGEFNQSIFTAYLILLVSFSIYNLRGFIIKKEE
jgi:hypothetical protein